jgi:5-methylcytosine-specific restriction endonuclease McrA
MDALSGVADDELLARMPALVQAERARTRDVIEHLIAIDQRRLYLDQACSSLTCYCIERLGYSEDEAAKRVTAARMARRFPGLLDELGAGGLHLTGLCLLAQYLTGENYEVLVGQARGQSKRRIQQLVAAHFPRPDLPSLVSPVPEQLGALPLMTAGAETGGTQAIRSGTDHVSAHGPAPNQPGRLEPRSAKRWSVQFTASAELYEKIQRAGELLSHAIRSGDLATLFERALDELIAKETKRRLGAQKPRRHRPLSPGSRHVPVEVARHVWERDGGQCTFVDKEGRRCSARRFLTIEHRHPFALGGPATTDNACLLCQAHNAQAARRVFGDAHVEARIRERRPVGQQKRDPSDTHDTARAALCNLGFSKREVERTLAELVQTDVATEVEPLLRAALRLLVPEVPLGRAG